MTSPEQPSAAEIADLLAWARSLSDTGADPAERAAYQATKTALLARIAGQPQPHDPPQGTACD